MPAAEAVAHGKVDDMNAVIARAAASAAAFAGAAALGLWWFGSRRTARQAAKRDIRAQLKTWEGEGGQLADAPSASSAPATR